MAEAWQDCPALGPGWKRREAFRKSGASCGRSDIYYQSPTGEKIRSKVELTRYLGPACDLTLFDFRQGILCHPVPKTHPLAVPSKKKKKPSKPAKAKKHQVGLQRSEVRKETPRKENKAAIATAPASLLVSAPVSVPTFAPASVPASVPASALASAPAFCENCGIRLSYDGIKRQRLRTLCKDCRAQRVAFNREQRLFKRVGCGECTACLVKEDCGACSTCCLQLPHDVASGLFCKCEQRRCLRIVEKSQGCGVCRGCQTQEDCGHCRICLRSPRPGLKRQWRCLQRRCFWHIAHRFRGHPQGCQQCPPHVVVSPTGKRDYSKRGSKAASQHHSQAPPLPPHPASQHPEPTELHISDVAPTSPAEFIYYCVDEDELQPYTNQRQNRKCGACTACLRRMDCGHCDFCCDKPKFGGSNQKRQKCRWRQCLQFAMKRLLPSPGSGSEAGAGLPPQPPHRKRPASARQLQLSTPLKAPLAVLTTPPGPVQDSRKWQAGRGSVLPQPNTDLVVLQEGTSSLVQVPGTAAPPTEAPIQVPGTAAPPTEAPVQEAQCSALSWAVALPQVKQEKADAPQEWTAATVLTSSTLQSGFPSKVVDPDLPLVKQEPPGPEELGEENKDYVSESTPAEEIGGVGTPVITEIFSLGGTRLRDAEAWLPRSKDLKKPEAKMQ
ncbi:methyl-CpG-binding domain protein 1 isoform X3 [Arvicanthis niloticus]|uniref:methyl-CpG-binding domain protein 1 isoform X3 n=1 Tax=Arvicanthis niloticus TaxID=61156 RepID=UPI001486D8BD|nr:methyl-CpG-binding domain protein 1 isoform X2 [Arvicanthis niloticus]